jgi:LysM repeat protein
MIFFFWLMFSIGVARWAASKGKNGALWAVLSMVISPILAGIVLFVILENERSAIETTEKEKEKQEAMEKEAILQQTTVRSTDFVKQIEKSFSLSENGLLDANEFLEKKKIAIADLISKKLRESPEDFLSALIPLVKRKALTQEDIAIIKKAVL